LERSCRKQALPLPTFHKYIRVEEFFDGIKFDNPTAYLKSLKIKKVEV